MNRRHLNYRNQKFKDWKNKVKLRISNILIYFAENNDNPDHMKLLGRVIEAIYNPLYSYVYQTKRLDEQKQPAFQVILALEVQELFKIINSKK